MIRLLDYVKANTHLTQLKKARETSRVAEGGLPRVDKQISNLETLLAERTGWANEKR
ncbi:hypothetical protein J2T13_000825 [Paenibacillus sp. DS2015]